MSDAQSLVDLKEGFLEVECRLFADFEGFFERNGGEFDRLAGAKLGQGREVSFDDCADFWVSAEGRAVGAVDQELVVGCDLDCALCRGFGAKVGRELAREVRAMVCPVSPS